MQPTASLKLRQIWALPTKTTTAEKRHCTPFHLPQNGILTINETVTITLTDDAIFDPQCTALPGLDDNGSTVIGTLVNLQDPFYASTLPQVYAVAAATVISYMLVIMLLITPRTFFIGGAGGGNGFLGRRGMRSGDLGNTAVVGVGGRPWLQKVATTAVAISLTIATVNTFKVAETQYDLGYQDAAALTDEVVGGLEIRVIRVISDTFLWLAQVQTLIRLFPRHREKVIIKWTGFALIVLDTVFSILNNFVSNSASKTQPRSFTDAVPALTYLFELGLSLLYAAWVIYYSFEKRRFAFFHVKMRNIFLVAIISLLAILIPVVFFVLDISKPSVIGWGDYVRWVGAAAASVVVWEWVERIEALEREERKDGILGREIFDGDEMLDLMPLSNVSWPGARRRQPHDRGDGFANGSGRSVIGKIVSHIRRQQSTSTHIQLAPHEIGTRAAIRQRPSPRAKAPSLHKMAPTLPPKIASPISRVHTTSATSTVYAVHYHIESEPVTSAVHNTFDHSLSAQKKICRQSHARQASTVTHLKGEVDPTGGGKNAKVAPTESASELWKDDPSKRWKMALNPFKRRRTSPPPEVLQAASRTLSEAIPETDKQQNLPATSHRSNVPSRWNLRRRRRIPEGELPTVVIPAQARGRVWSPGIVEEESVAISNISKPVGQLPPNVVDASEPGITSPAMPHPSILPSQSLALRARNLQLGSSHGVIIESEESPPQKSTATPTVIDHPGDTSAVTSSLPDQVRCEALLVELQQHQLSKISSAEHEPSNQIPQSELTVTARASPTITRPQTPNLISDLSPSHDSLAPPGIDVEYPKPPLILKILLMFMV